MHHVDLSALLREAGAARDQLVEAGARYASNDTEQNLGILAMAAKVYGGWREKLDATYDEIKTRRSWR